jgi:hypothetical protein
LTPDLISTFTKFVGADMISNQNIPLKKKTKNCFAKFPNARNVVVNA